MHLNKHPTILVLGTGGTIAGLATDPENPINYKASQLGITDILRRSGLDNQNLECRDIAKIDSKDMGPVVWRDLLKALSEACDRPDLQAIVITHGTDTLEETAYLLNALGPWKKPLVLTCAMKPANAADADGPGNLRDALALAGLNGIPSVSMVCAGQVHDPLYLQKTRTDQADGFSSGPSGPLGWMVDGQWRPAKQLEKAPPKTKSDAIPSLQALLATPAWPRVEWVTNHAGNAGDIVHALLDHRADASAPLRGLVVAATGSGTASLGMEAALASACQAGIRVVICSRPAWGRVVGQHPKAWGSPSALSPAKAWVSLSLALLAEDENIKKPGRPGLGL